MTRRRIILAAVALLLAAFVMAVQRDTFVRRWCLPTPPPATREFATQGAAERSVVPADAVTG